MSELTAASSPSTDEQDSESLFPIREVARQTGVNPVTLRAWERRYGLIKPLRTAKGHRLFTAEHIELIHKILEWLERGVAVSQVKPLLVDNNPAPVAADSPWRTMQDEWLAWIEQLAERQLDTAFQQAMVLYPPETLCQHLLLPLRVKTQQQWGLNEGARVEQVFFMTWLRTQLASRIAHNNRLHNSAPLLVVSLSEQPMDPEPWLCAWLASYSECPVRVLEWPIPAPDLALAFQRIQPRAVLLNANQRLQLPQLEQLIEGLDCPLILSGQAALIHQEHLKTLPQLNSAVDPLQTLHCLVQLNLLQNH